jgi:hypothetical protein
MKKIYILTIVLLFCISLGYAQTTLFTDNFESYTAGSKLVQQAPGTDWTTWSNAPGGSEDPIVTDAQANGGTKSVKIMPNNDLVLKLNDKTTGRYQIKMFAKVPSGKIGYFNVLQDFASSNSIWGMELYFNVNGTGTVHAGGENAGEFVYTQGTWVPISLIIDLDDDFATLYVNNNEVVSWVWSTGSQGSNNLQKLDAVNFYGPASGGSAETYFDDIEFIEQVDLAGPTNLVATVAGSDINLTWDAPTTGAPDNYSIVRNGVVINSTTTGTTYNDASLYPNTYVYEVKAHFTGLGYSPSSNIDEGTIPGGLERTKVLYEIATGTWCQYCPGAAMGADDLVASGHDVAIIEYHSGDEYENTAGADRISYYAVPGYPTTRVDGVIEMVGGNATTSLYPSYLNFYNERKPVPSIHFMDKTIEHVSGNTYRATITIEQFNNYFASDLVLHTALTESHIPDTWLSGMTEVNFVCREMYPSAAGTPLDFSTSNTLTFTFEFSVAGYVFENLEFVAFVQHNPSKEVVQSISHMMLFTDIKTNKKLELTAFPNPTTDFINLQVNTQKPISYMITDVMGKVIVPMTQVASEITKINVSDWNSGVYIIKTNDGYSRKFTVANY